MDSLLLRGVIRALLVCLIASGLSLTVTAESRAGGGQHYPNGAEDFVVGALPPPGTYLVNYLIFAQKNDLKNNSGNDVPVEFSADVVAEVPRFIYVSPYTLLGANWAAHIFIPFYSADLEIGTSAATPKNIVDSDEAGIGDIIFSPLVFGWHFGPNFHTVAAVDFYAPTGDYDMGRPATQVLSRNHWTIEPLVAVTYLWRGFDFSGKFMYDFNTTNDEYLIPGTTNVVDLDPGQEFHFDWAIGYAAQDGLRGGLVGYNYWQTTDDEVDGVSVEDSRSRVGGIGLGLKYWPKQGPFSMTLKHYWEYSARNIPTGPQTQFKVSYAF